MTQPSTVSAMTYTHVRAWLVIGGIGMPQGVDTLPLTSGDGWSFSLEKDIDAACALSDRGAALGHLALQGIFGPAKVGTLDERLADELNEIRQARRNRTGSYPVLLFKALGPVDVSIGNSAQHRADFVLTFDAFDKAAIRQQYVRQHRSVQLALAMESKGRVRFDEITTGTYCTNADGLTVYSLTMTGGNAELIVASPLLPEAADRLHRRAGHLNKSADLESCMRLFADMAIYGREPFRVFNSGWSALEILINKTFRDYEERFFSALQVPHQAELAAMYLDSVRKKMEGKHSLMDRFTMVSAVLLPEQSKEAALADVAAFKEIKQLRDTVAHGSAFDEAGMPVSQLCDLLMKYLAAHTSRAMGALLAPADAGQTGSKHV